MKRSLLALAALAALSACPPIDTPGGNGGGGGGATASLSGKLTLFQGLSSGGRGRATDEGLRAVLKRTAARSQKLEGLSTRGATGPGSAWTPPAVALPPLADDEVVPGQVLVRFETGALAQSPQGLAALALPGLQVKLAAPVTAALRAVEFRHADGTPLAEAETRALPGRLAGRTGLRYVELNRVRRAFALPNDRFYAVQWHYPAINLPAAWDVTQGSNSVVVAVLDTGTTPHPDLTSREVAGYDMLEDPANGGDGDGRDNNPRDTGRDFPQGRSSWHGTHVAGTIGAASNNGAGVAGVDWNARIQHVRVLGRQGGADSDVLAGIVWASGGSVPGVPANPTPAAVLNLSLGGKSPPSQAWQEAIDEAVGRGAIVVVAAGNANSPAQDFTPCNQTNLICVGATRFDNVRASYSNFGTGVHVMAPGGELQEDKNGDGASDGVLSTYRNQEDTEAGYDFLQGTSMASPHVAGVVALLKARTPALTGAQARTILTSTAVRTADCPEGCGAGLINVQAALQQGGNMMPAGPARLTLNTSELSYGTGTTSQTVVAFNTGGQPLTVQVRATGTAAGRLTVTGQASRTVPAGQSVSFTISASLAGLAATESAALDFDAGAAGQATVAVRFPAPRTQARPAVVAAAYEDAQGEWQSGGAGEATPPGFTFSFNVEAVAGREYFLIAGIDANGNGEFEDDEPLGLYPNTDSPEAISVASGQRLTGLNFAVLPQTKLDEGAPANPVGAACTDNATCGPGGECITAWPGGLCSLECSAVSCPLGSRCLDLTDEVRACLPTCTGPGAGRSTCRTGYVCYDDDAGGGLCLPDCTVFPQVCPQGLACSSAGYCQ